MTTPSNEVAADATPSRPAPRPSGRPGRRPPRRFKALIVVVSYVLAAALLIWYVPIGTADVTFGDVVRVLRFTVTGAAVPEDFQSTFTIVQGLRLPRILVAAVAGASLSLAGVVMQAILRNPLVSPFTLGVSPAAAFGAALVILTTGGAGNAVLVTAAAFVTATVASVLVLGLAHSKSSGQITATVLLLGIALTQLFEAATSALQFIADEDTLSAIVRWTFGSVNDANWSDFSLIGVVLVASLLVILPNAKHLNAIAFAGEDAARSLGANVTAIRFGLIGVSVLLASVVVSLCGVIGFVGLVGPHIARMIIGADHRYLIPFSVVTGAILLATADTVGRTIISPIVVPVGIVIAVVGAPLFIYLILSRRTGR
ncbi:FecCD family ABC transporter permease [Jiangella endophytica]|uniref:FecCD family ABC transporter permease n=1 Tax=Jiangella endophytica TaxID=1623398 RepID=UPI0018E5263B|nr:iron ABC transporter permease [Jiangella endophytica]